MIKRERQHDKDMGGRFLVLFEVQLGRLTGGSEENEDIYRLSTNIATQISMYKCLLH
jgi:hypothetical protein